MPIHGSNQPKPILVGLWAPPGVGKSSIAAMVFNVLKFKGVKAELVMEFAKDVTYEHNWKALEDPFYITAVQERRCSRLIGEVEVIVTDSPVGLSCLYANERDVPLLRDLTTHLRGRYRCMDWRLERDASRQYQQFGRRTTFEESTGLEAQLTHEMGRLCDKYRVTRADALAGTYIADAVMRGMERGTI